MNTFCGNKNSFTRKAFVADDVNFKIEIDFFSDGNSTQSESRVFHAFFLLIEHNINS
jgi:hypothetical protein